MFIIIVLHMVFSRRVHALRERLVVVVYIITGCLVVRGIIRKGIDL